MAPKTDAATARNNYMLPSHRYDVILWMFGMLFLSILMALMFGIGGFIVALVLIMMIEFRDRGIFFGFPTPQQIRGKQDSVWLSPVYLIRKYHGYFIYWATITTFWYHPMENTLGHAFGFAHTWFMMLQGSLVFTKLHLNKYWRFLLEIWVIIHAGVVAVQVTPIDPNSEKLSNWPMFVFGFATITLLTQAYGLPLWKKLPSWARAIPISIYIVILLTTYSFLEDKQGRAFTRIQEIIRIPGIFYLLLLFGWLIIVLFSKIQRVYKARKTQTTEEGSDQADETTPTPLLRHKEVLLLIAVLLIYIGCTFLTWIVEFLDWKTANLTLLFVLNFCFMFLGPIVGSFIFTHIIPMTSNPTPDAASDSKIQ